MEWMIAVTVYFMVLGLILLFNYGCHRNNKYFEVDERDEYRKGDVKFDYSNKNK